MRYSSAVLYKLVADANVQVKSVDRDLTNGKVKMSYRLDFGDISYLAEGMDDEEWEDSAIAEELGGSKLASKKIDNLVWSKIRNTADSLEGIDVDITSPHVTKDKLKKFYWEVEITIFFSVAWADLDAIILEQLKTYAIDLAKKPE